MGFQHSMASGRVLSHSRVMFGRSPFARRVLNSARIRSGNVEIFAFRLSWLHFWFGF
jgi:hypothetical protein